MSTDHANLIPSHSPLAVARFQPASARIVAHEGEGALAGVLLRGVNAMDKSTWPLTLHNAAEKGQHVLVATGWVTGESPAWLPSNRPAFDAFAAHFATLASDAGVIPTLVPFRTGVLSDAPSTLTFLRGSASKGWRFVLSPADLWTPELLPNAHDHMLRLLETIALHEAFAGWIMPRGLGKHLCNTHEAIELPEAVVQTWRSAARGAVIEV
jgi:hypothetical protein